MSIPGTEKRPPTALEESRLIPVSLGSQGLIRVRPDSIGSRLNRRDQASQLSIAGLKQKRPEAKASGRF